MDTRGPRSQGLSVPVRSRQCGRGSPLPRLGVWEVPEKHPVAARSAPPTLKRERSKRRVFPPMWEGQSPAATGTSRVPEMNTTEFFTPATLKAQRPQRQARRRRRTCGICLKPILGCGVFAASLGDLCGLSAAGVKIPLIVISHLNRNLNHNLLPQRGLRLRLRL